MIKSFHSVSWECPVTAEPFCSDSCFHGNSHSAGLWEGKFSTGIPLTESLRHAFKVSAKKSATLARRQEAIFEWMSMEEERQYTAFEGKKLIL